MADDRGLRAKPDDWASAYEAKEMPWDSGLPDRELRQCVESRIVEPGSAIDLGCGTGTNAVFLAQLGFKVTAIDFTPNAIELAKSKAQAAGVSINFHCADVTKLDAVTEKFEFMFDRGCYHCVRKAGGLGGYMKTVERLTLAGSRMLVLAGNPDANETGGPPRVTAAELCGDFEKRFMVERLTAMRFQDADGSDGPLGWSALLTRR